MPRGPAPPLTRTCEGRAQKVTWSFVTAICPSGSTPATRQPDSHVPLPWLARESAPMNARSSAGSVPAGAPPGRGRQ